MRDWRSKIIFWVGILTSCLWLVATVALAQSAIRLVNPAGPSPLELLAIAAFVLQPLVILALIVRAIRLRNKSQSWHTVGRAIYPLAFIPLLFAAVPYLSFQADARMTQKWRTGSITFVCSAQALYADPKIIGVGNLKLTEVRHPGKLSTWFVIWPGDAPIETKSFNAHTGSIGGSQGINWLSRDGQQMRAYLSFSDMMTEYGSETLWGELAQVAANKVFTPDSGADSTFTCQADPTTYRP